jgi:hypothetical protein
MSHGSTCTLAAPSSSASLAVSARFCSLRASSDSFACSVARRSEIARPMPVPAPVMTM